MDSRRDFIRKAGGLGLLALGGCRCPTGCVREDAVSPNYWCTWGIQNRMLGKVKRSPLAFAGDQGAVRARDNTTRISSSARADGRGFSRRAAKGCG